MDTHKHNYHKKHNKSTHKDQQEPTINKKNRDCSTAINYKAARWNAKSLWIIFVVVMCVMPASAETKLFKHRAADGTMTFSDAPLVNGEVVRSNYRNQYGRQMTTNSCSGLTTAQLEARGSQYHSAIVNVAAALALEPHWILAVARVESCFDSKALSRAGAQGLMQLMPATARELGVTDSLNAMQNLSGGARYLDSMKRRFSDMNLALAAYNAGPGNVDRYKGIPPFPETTQYIEQVTRFAKEYESLF